MYYINEIYTIFNKISTYINIYYNRKNYSYDYGSKGCGFDSCWARKVGALNIQGFF